MEVPFNYWPLYLCITINYILQWLSTKLFRIQLISGRSVARDPPNINHPCEAFSISYSGLYRSPAGSHASSFHVVNSWRHATCCCSEGDERREKTQVQPPTVCISLSIVSWTLGWVLCHVAELFTNCPRCGDDTPILWVR